MKPILLFTFLTLIFSSCYKETNTEQLIGIQIQDRNGILETINQQDRLKTYEKQDFLSSQPYQKVLRVFKEDGKNHSVLTTYHPSGALWQYLEAVEMRAFGKYREYYQNSLLKIDANVVGGSADLQSQQDWIFDGISEVFFEDGSLRAQILYSKGNLEGESIYYYLNGQIEKKLFFKQNVLDGDAISYFMDGQVSAIETYKEGLLEEGKYFDKNNQEISKIEKGFGFKSEYTDQAILIVEYKNKIAEGKVEYRDLSGNLLKSYTIKEGKKQGPEYHYFLSFPSDNSPKLMITWKDNMIHGSVKTWYPNKKLESDRQFCQNNKSGPSLAWYPDGSLMLLEEYENDLLMKGSYYKKGQKEPVSSVVMGNGISTIFDEESVLIKKIPYSKGKPLIKD
jgi:antitoxin component YwqK of YwqJK toxin-antitoxin module